jgi:hypothetical protein
MSVQGSTDEAVDQVLVVARTTIGHRPGRPDFGIPDFTHTKGVQPQTLENLLTEQVPDTVITADDSRSDPRERHDHITLTVRSTADPAVTEVDVDV